MRFLIKYPTRGRPAQFIRMAQLYRSMLSRKHPVRFVVSIDHDDRLMHSSEIRNYLRRQKDMQVFEGHSTGKIAAVNADFDKLGDYDVLILASDDMVPVVRHYDLIIERLMKAKFPAMDGCLHFSDGYNAAGLNTMPIAGKRLFDSWGYIYHPDYVAEWCDNEFQAVTERDGKSYKTDTVLFKHEWREHTGRDDTAVRSEGFSSRDRATFLRREAAGFPKTTVGPGEIPVEPTAPVAPVSESSTLLSILICSLPERVRFLTRLQGILRRQAVNKPVEILVDDRGRDVTIGAKRNALLQRATGRYVAFIDDDDMVVPRYVDLVLAALASKPDCTSLRGTITTDGRNPKQFVHTLDCKEWLESDGIYWRSPNHLNAIRRDLAIQAGFPEKNFGEDHEFSKRLLPLLKMQADIEQTLYNYQFRSRK